MTREKLIRLRALTASMSDRRSAAGIRGDVLLEILDDLDAAAAALVALRDLAGAAGRIDTADAYLTSFGFAYPFMGYRAPISPEGS